MAAKKANQNRSVATTHPATIASWSSSPIVRISFAAALLATLVFLAYRPSFNGGFILDDDLLLTQNEIVKSSDGLRQFWFSSRPADYWPVTNTTLWLEWRLWGERPLGYRLTNVLLHIGESLLLWLILRRLSIPGAYLAALLFALHPVNVESVAWIASRKNLMAMLFSELSALCYLKLALPSASGEERSSRRKALRYGLSLMCFVLAVLGKGSAVVLPVLLLLVILWRGLPWKENVLRLLPFFALSIPLALLNVWFQTHGTEIVVREAGFLERLLTASGAIWFYLYKASLPVNLSFVYPLWTGATGDWRFWLACVALPCSFVALWRHRKKDWGRALFYGWLFFCVALFPSLGFADVGFMRYSLAADRYQHFALLAVATLLAAAWAYWRNATNNVDEASWAIAGFVALVLFGLTYHRAEAFGTPKTLYGETLAVNPNSWMIRNNYGYCFQQEGDWEKAAEQYRMAIETKPDYGPAHTNLGHALAIMDQPDEAIAVLERATQLEPDAYEAFSNLGNAYLLKGRMNDGIAAYKKAIEVNPKFADAWSNYGLALFNQGKYEESLAKAQEALRLNPNSFDYRNHTAIAAVAAKNYALAVELYPGLLKARPNDSGMLNNYGLALTGVGRAAEAIACLRRAAELEPGLIQTYMNLADAYVRAGRSAEAEGAAKRALDIARAEGNAGRVKRIEDWLKKHNENY